MEPEWTELSEDASATMGLFDSVCVAILRAPVDGRDPDAA